MAFFYLFIINLKFGINYATLCLCKVNRLCFTLLFLTFYAEIVSLETFKNMFQLILLSYFLCKLSLDTFL